MSSAACCPTCGRAWPKAKAPQPVAPNSGAIDTSALSDAALLAYFKRIGTREDTRFWLSRARVIPEDIRAQGAALLAELETRDGKPADAKRLLALKFKAASAADASIHPCGHRHTHLSTAVACYAGVPIPPEGETDDYKAERDALLAALGWTGYQVRKPEPTTDTEASC